MRKKKYYLLALAVASVFLVGFVLRGVVEDVLLSRRSEARARSILTIPSLYCLAVTDVESGSPADRTGLRASIRSAYRRSCRRISIPPLPFQTSGARTAMAWKRRSPERTFLSAPDGPSPRRRRRRTALRRQKS